jgi:GNAT superfamily N-acetyltransferase
VARPAREADLHGIAGLYHAVWHETHARFVPAEESRRRTPAFFLERMTGLLPATVVVVRGGILAGFAAWSGPLLGQLYVAAAQRGTGVAVALLTEAERRMANLGVETAELHCILGNDRARCFYERAGWTHAGKAIEPVEGPNGLVELEFWCMTKALIPGDLPKPG